MTYQRCKIGLWDTTIPGIKFDAEGVSNYCRMQLSLMNLYPRGRQGLEEWEQIVQKMKNHGVGKRYDCIVGISGGTDSSYLMHIAHEYGLRTLAVNLDNGWNSDIAVKNMRRITSALNFDLETWVIDYEEVKAVLRAYIFAALPWIDSPTDIAIKAALYKVAVREKVEYVLNGSDFRSEGKQPLAWTYSDTKQLKYLVKRFNRYKLKTFPTQSLFSYLLYGFVYKIKVVRPLYFIPYQKSLAKNLLQEKYGWIDYGGHHHENIYTKFAIAYWLPEKFGIDKRIITYSAQVLSGDISREEAIALVNNSPFDKFKIQNDINYVLKKLDFDRSEFDRIFASENKYFYDYPSFYPFVRRFSKIGKSLSSKIFGFKPGIFEAIDQGM